MRFSFESFDSPEAFNFFTQPDSRHAYVHILAKPQHRHACRWPVPLLEDEEMDRAHQVNCDGDDHEFCDRLALECVNFAKLPADVETLKGIFIFCALHEIMLIGIIDAPAAEARAAYEKAKRKTAASLWRIKKKMARDDDQSSRAGFA